MRERLIKNRTALCNEIRGLLSEYGLVVGQGVPVLRRTLPRLLEEADNGLTDRIRGRIADLWDELKDLEERIARTNAKIEIEVCTSEVCRRLKGVPGVGSLTASAIVASVGNPNGFKNGREFSASLGLVPRQHSSGGKDRLLGISKRGDQVGYRVQTKRPDVFLGLGESPHHAAYLEIDRAPKRARRIEEDLDAYAQCLVAQNPQPALVYCCETNRRAEVLKGAFKSMSEVRQYQLVPFYVVEVDRSAILLDKLFNFGELVNKPLDRMSFIKDNQNATV